MSPQTTLREYDTPPSIADLTGPAGGPTLDEFSPMHRAVHEAVLFETGQHGAADLSGVFTHIHDCSFESDLEAEGVLWALRDLAEAGYLEKVPDGWRHPELRELHYTGGEPPPFDEPSLEPPRYAWANSELVMDGEGYRDE